MALPSLAPAVRPALAEVKLREVAPGYTQPTLIQNAAAPKTDGPRSEPRIETTPEPVPAPAAPRARPAPPAARPAAPGAARAAGGTPQGARSSRPYSVPSSRTPS